MANADMLDFYSRPGPMTEGGRHAAVLESLPNDLDSLVRIVQGLALHEFTAAALQGVEIAPGRRFESHIRAVERMLDRLQVLDGRPLDVSRPPALRLVGVCHHFALLLLAMLRAKRVPARARWGFGAWFNPPYFEDHVLCEVWRASESRWVLVDAQLDETWRRQPGFDIDTLDVSRSRFIIAADAWIRCRDGRADPARFGIFKGNQRGLWFIACNLLKDVAALAKQETLPWDAWGAMPQPGSALDADQLAFFDRIAALTRSPDESFPELLGIAESDERVRVPGVVFNTVLARAEAFRDMVPDRR